MFWKGEKLLWAPQHLCHTFPVVFMMAFQLEQWP